MADWNVFQRDVLDVLRQYEGYFDYFERVGSLSDNSRPDCFGRISRSDKKELWVLDAKNKAEVTDEDRVRMDNYITMLKSNPIDSGLEISEISEYSFRGIFVTSSDVNTVDYESVAFNSLHQFIQKELVYTDTEKAVRDISKMMQRQQLTHSQARLLFRSLKPYQKRFQKGIKLLENVESDYAGLDVVTPPFTGFDSKIPVDALVRHEERNSLILFDIPYSREAAKSVDGKAGEIKSLLESEDRNIFYAAINMFESVDSNYLIEPGEIRNEVRETLGILSTETVAELFSPKIKTEKKYGDGEIRLESEQTGFMLASRSENDIDHRVEAVLPEKALKQIKNSYRNSQISLGEVKGDRFIVEFSVTPDFSIQTEREQSYGDFSSAVKSVYSNSVNPVLGKIYSRKESIK